MNAKRKLISLLLSVVMVMSVLSGCGQTAKEETKTNVSETQKETSKESDSVKETENAATEELEYVELDWYVYMNSQSTDANILQEALDEYFLEKLNCKVNLHAIKNSEYVEKMSAAVSSGEPIDILFLGNAFPYATYADMGALYPMNDLLERYPNVKGLFADGVWESLKMPDGEVYCVPTLKDNAYFIGRYTNTTMLEALGYTMEDIQWNDWTEMEEDCVELIKARNEKFPEYAEYPLIASAMPNDIPYFYQAEKLVNGTDLANCNIPGLELDAQYDVDTVFNYYETDAFRELALMRQRLVEAGVFAYDYDTFEGSLSPKEEVLFRAAWGGCWAPEDKYGDAFDVTLEVFPTIYTDSSYYLAAANAIGANSKDPERAMMVLECLNTDPYLATMMRFGVEGEHWQRNAEGNMELFNRNADTSKPGWIEWFGISMGNLTIAEAPLSYSGPDNILFDKMAQYNSEAILAPHMGFVVDTTNITNEISACTNVITEYKHLSLGQSESQEAVNKEVDEFIAKLKANGSDKIVAEVQAQLDAWLANK